MKYRTLIFLLALLVATCGWNISSALANSSYYVYNQWGGTYYDAEKSPTNTEDDLMCWAASASNILAWTGWGKSYSSSADAIFAYFQNHWTDAGGSVYYAWDWWFGGTNISQGVSGTSQVDVPGGGFWTGYSVSDYFLWTTQDAAAMWAIENLFDMGYGVSLSIATSSGGAHAITCWGYQYDANGKIVGVYVTDSDDSKNLTNPTDILAYYAVVNKGGEWYLQNFEGSGSNAWYIAEVLGLKNINSVPEPATMLLLGLGLIGLAGLWRKPKTTGKGTELTDPLIYSG